MKLSIGFLISAKNFLLDLLFPIHCLICRKKQNFQENHLCPSCFDKIKLKTDQECAFCSAHTVNGQTCPFCRPKHYLDFLWATADYHEPIIKKTLWALKYRFVKDLAAPLGQLICIHLRRKKIDKFLETYRRQILVIPVPLHRKRFNWRSYNQSELLAGELAAEFNLKMEQKALIRLRHRQPQAELKDKGERAKNVKNTFVCQEPEKIKNNIVLLIDDISTTGSTLDECAKILKESGAEKVIGLVVAKG